MRRNWLIFCGTLVIFTFASFFVKMSIVSAEAETRLGFSSTDYQKEIGEQRSDLSRRLNPFEPEKISISTPTLSKNSKGQFQLVYKFGYPMTRGGLTRFLEYRVKLSKELDSLVSGINIDPIGARIDDSPLPSKQKYSFDNRIDSDSDGQRVLSSGAYLKGAYNGGEANVYLTMKRSFIPENSYISSYMLSNTEVNTPVYPAFESVRNLEYARFGENYNRQLLDTEKKDQINNIKTEYAKLISKVKSSKMNQIAKKKTSQLITDIMNKANKDINDQSRYEDSVLDDIDKIAREAISSMNNALSGITEVSLKHTPNLIFGEQQVNSDNLLLKTVNYQNIEGSLYTTQPDKKFKWSIQLSITDFRSNNNKSLGAKYVMNGNVYNPNTSFLFYEGDDNVNNNFMVKKTPDEGVKLLLNSGNHDAGEYHAKATWTVVNSPVE